MGRPELTFHPLEPGRWRDVERLFGEKGACAGCWCVFWRLEKGERFSEVKGAEAKRRFKALVERGEARGLLAYAGERPVGWLSFGPRKSFPKLDRAPSLKCDDAERVWSLPCFFVHKDFRGQGVASGLLKHALPLMKRAKAEVAEGYPVLPPAHGKVPAAFAYTGTVDLFQAQGFSPTVRRPKGKQRMRKELR